MTFTDVILFTAFHCCWDIYWRPFIFTRWHQPLFADNTDTQTHSRTHSLLRRFCRRNATRCL